MPTGQQVIDLAAGIQRRRDFPAPPTGFAGAGGRTGQIAPEIPGHLPPKVTATCQR